MIALVGAWPYVVFIVAALPWLYLVARIVISGFTIHPRKRRVQVATPPQMFRGEPRRYAAGDRLVIYGAYGDLPHVWHVVGETFVNSGVSPTIDTSLCDFKVFKVALEPEVNFTPLSLPREFYPKELTHD